jgi:MAF protein
LVALLGLPWRTSPAAVDEEAYLLPEPAVSALNVAVAKARATIADVDEVVLAADTLVVREGAVLGKPADPEVARGMLTHLRGRPHHVLTGVVLRAASLQWGGVVDTQVMMRDYSDAEMEAYIGRGEPFDKAGAYAVQDEVFRPVERLDGCYLNVVGLPLCAVAAGLTALGQTPERAGAPPCSYCERGAVLVRSGS